MSTEDRLEAEKARALEAADAILADWLITERSDLPQTLGGLRKLVAGAYARGGLDAYQDILERQQP